MFDSFTIVSLWFTTLINIYSNSSPVHLLHQLSPMFEVDPLFTRTFLLTLPIHDIAKVLQRKLFPLHEVCWTLARVVEERPDHTYVLPEGQVS